MVVASLCVALAAAPSVAQDFPNRPVRIIVPFSPGGAVDGPTRVLAHELTKRLGQQVVIDNRPGAGATIGAEAVAKSAPDGYTLLLASQTNAISATLYTKLSFNPIDDFAPISLIGREPGVVVVHPSLPVKTVQELIELARSQPGQIDYASSGNGSGQHLFAAQLFSLAGVTLNHVPYRGSGQATTDLIGGVVKVGVPGLAGMLPHIRSGKLRALAITGSQRSPQLPDVPTLAESGYPGYSAYVWLGLLAPKDTPSAIIDLLNREVLAALGTPEVKTYMANASIDVLGSTPAEFGAYFRAERDTWARVIKLSGAKLD
ncbi:MAG TPA: tripartite tricarboxylate transporter substrate binding protein [Burkholderiaceae bacterium]|nr:tripartite tricarboxylate transporter substrate binding protein [Burkholderiaceae bacterium]